MGALAAADRTRAIARSLGLRPGRRRRQAGVLTEREQQIALLVAAGKTNNEIGATLYLSPRTIERHVGNILTTLGHRSRVQLAAQIAAGQLPGAPTPQNTKTQAGNQDDPTISAEAVSHWQTPPSGRLATADADLPSFSYRVSRRRLHGPRSARRAEAGDAATPQLRPLERG